MPVPANALSPGRSAMEDDADHSMRLERNMSDYGTATGHELLARLSRRGVF